MLLKWQCQEIFDFRFFSWISFPQAPEYPIRAASIFFENSRRYSQLKKFTIANFLFYEEWREVDGRKKYFDELKWCEATGPMYFFFAVVFTPFPLSPLLLLLAVISLLLTYYFIAGAALPIHMIGEVSWEPKWRRSLWCGGNDEWKCEGIVRIVLGLPVFSSVPKLEPES